MSWTGTGFDDDDALPPSLANSEPWVVNATDKVTVELLCIIDHDFCAKVLDAIRHAVGYFTELVYLRRQLVIRAVYYEFCDHVCANDTYGMGSPAKQFTLPFKDGDMNFAYPQALAKQLSPYEYTGTWTGHDIVIELNHDPYMMALLPLNASDASTGGGSTMANGSIPRGGKYWFRADGTNESILPYQVDFESIVLHQLLHGVGFASSWAAYFSSEASPFRTLLEQVVPVHQLKMLTPNPYWTVEPVNGGPTYMTGFQPTMIFDKFLYLDNGSTSLMEMGFAMQEFCAQGNDAFILHFVQQLQASPISAMARQLYDVLDQAKSPLTFQFTPPPASNTATNGSGTCPVISSASGASNATTMVVPMAVPEEDGDQGNGNDDDNARMDINEYLQRVYRGVPLLSSHSSLNALDHHEQPSRLFRPGVSLAHVDDTREHGLDFIMTATYQEGTTLQAWTQKVYRHHPALFYELTSDAAASQNWTSAPTSEDDDNDAGNSAPPRVPTIITKKKRYASPIGPGILRILQAMGYNTILAPLPPADASSSSSSRSSVASHQEKKRCNDAYGMKPPPSKTKLANPANPRLRLPGIVSLNSVLCLVSIVPSLFHLN
ncbi:hypothetical protein BC940DRAFT_319791 [Gongronella butleri]|nr:hypothetical protein BC940DRAFT_319791 [Gongronella butleri]